MLHDTLDRGWVSKLSLSDPRRGKGTRDRHGRKTTRILWVWCSSYGNDMGDGSCGRGVKGREESWSRKSEKTRVKYIRKKSLFQVGLMRYLTKPIHPKKHRDWSVFRTLPSLLLVALDLVTNHWSSMSYLYTLYFHESYHKSTDFFIQSSSYTFWSTRYHPSNRIYDVLCP